MLNKFRCSLSIAADVLRANGNDDILHFDRASTQHKTLTVFSAFQTPNTQGTLYSSLRQLLFRTRRPTEGRPPVPASH